MKSKKLLLLILMTILASSSALAQDVIVKHDATEIEARIVEITDNQIKYQRFSNLEGPIYSVAQNDVLMIKYENGEKDVFLAPKTPPATETRSTAAPASVPAVNRQMTIDGGKIYFGGQHVNYQEALTYVQKYPQAARHLNAGHTLNVLSDVFLYPGCFLVGWGIGELIAGGEGLELAVGLPMVLLVALPLSLAGTSHYKKAALAYNSASSFAGIPKYEWELAIAPTKGGLGLQLKF